MTKGPHTLERAIAKRTGKPSTHLCKDPDTRGVKAALRVLCRRGEKTYSCFFIHACRNFGKMYQEEHRADRARRVGRRIPSRPVAVPGPQTPTGEPNTRPRGSP